MNQQGKVNDHQKGDYMRMAAVDYSGTRLDVFNWPSLHSKTTEPQKFHGPSNKISKGQFFQICRKPRSSGLDQGQLLPTLSSETPLVSPLDYIEILGMKFNHLLKPYPHIAALTSAIASQMGGR